MQAQKNNNRFSSGDHESQKRLIQYSVLSKTISHSWRRKPCCNKKDLRNLWPLSKLYRRHRKEYIALRRLDRPKTVWATNNSRTLNQRGLIDHHKNNITTGINTHFTKIIINIGDFSIPIKRHRLDWLWKQEYMIHEDNKSMLLPWAKDSYCRCGLFMKEWVWPASPPLLLLSLLLLFYTSDLRWYSLAHSPFLDFQPSN